MNRSTECAGDVGGCDPPNSCNQTSRITVRGALRVPRQSASFERPIVLQSSLTRWRGTGLHVRSSVNMHLFWRSSVMRQTRFRSPHASECLNRRHLIRFQFPSGQLVSEGDRDTYVAGTAVETWKSQRTSLEHPLRAGHVHRSWRWLVQDACSCPLEYRSAGRCCPPSRWDSIGMVLCGPVLGPSEVALTLPVLLDAPTGVMTNWGKGWGWARFLLERSSTFHFSVHRPRHTLITGHSGGRARRHGEGLRQGHVISTGYHRAPALTRQRKQRGWRPAGSCGRHRAGPRSRPRACPRSRPRGGAPSPWKSEEADTLCEAPASAGAGHSYELRRRDGHKWGHSRHPLPGVSIFDGSGRDGFGGQGRQRFRTHGNWRLLDRWGRTVQKGQGRGQGLGPLEGRCGVLETRCNALSITVTSVPERLFPGRLRRPITGRLPRPYAAFFWLEPSRGASGNRAGEVLRKSHLQYEVFFCYRLRVVCSVLYLCGRGRQPAVL